MPARRSSPRTLRRIWTVLGILAVPVAIVVAPQSFPGSGVGPALAAPSAATAYVPIQPCRLADTRAGTGFTRIDASTVQISSRNVCGLPSSATSLALTLTVVNPPAAGYLTAWPTGQSRPVVSNINFAAHQIRANGSITRLDSSGTFRVFTNTPTDVVVDVVGAFVPSGPVAAGRFVPSPSTRLLDTRTGARLPAGSKVTFAVPAGVPADAAALALNLTVTESANAGFVTQYPAGQPMPTSSVLNVDAAGQTRAAAGIFPVSKSGGSLYLSGGGHVVVDMVGYFTGPSAGASTEGLFTAYDPTRLLDTRLASPLGDGVPLHPGGGLELAVGRGGSMAYNITAADAAPGFLIAHPAGTPRPGTSNVNSNGAGDVAANFAITQMSNRGLGIYSQSRAHVLVDLQGWFSGPTAVATTGVPTNLPPPPPPVPQVTYSTCTQGGLATLNSRRPAANPLVANAAADAFACEWALKLAASGAISHSDVTARTNATGCPAAENVAYAGSTSVDNMYEMWFNSPGHLANIENTLYRSVGIAFVVRTDPNGVTRMFGVTDFALC